MNSTADFAMARAATRPGSSLIEKLPLQKRVLLFVGLWAASVAVLGVIGWLLREWLGG